MEFLLVFGMLGSSVAILDTPQRVFKLGLLLDETHNVELKASFDMLVKEINKNGAVLSFPVIEGVTIDWTAKDSPQAKLEKIKEHVIDNNITTVLSFTSLTDNHIFVNVLSKAIIPVIGLGSLAEEYYSSSKVGKSDRFAI